MLRSIGQHKMDSLFIYACFSDFSLVDFVSCLFYFNIEKQHEDGRVERMDLGRIRGGERI